jgi:carboxylesterase type B
LCFALLFFIMTIPSWLSLSLWASSALAAPSYTANKGYPTTPTVKVKNGTLAGTHSSQYNQDFFLGIPYAQPPVGQLRFAAPKPYDSKYDGTRDASQYPPTCVGYGSDNWPYPNFGEDCLYLNIVRPSGFEGKELPVGFWIHGGGLTEGSGGDARYNMSFIVNRSVEIGKPFIGVTINYRLSMWGFVTGDEVVKTGNANAGLRDQRMAMHWIKENIKAFGGMLTLFLLPTTVCLHDTDRNLQVTQRR